MRRNKRVSVEKAEYRFKCEDDYRRMVQDMAFRIGFSVIVRDGCSLLVAEQKEEILCTCV